MASKPGMIPVEEKPPKTVGRFVPWLLTVFVVLVLLFGAAVLNNNHSIGARSRTKFTAQLDRAIETSTRRIVQNPDNYGNPPLMFMVGDMAEMSADPRLQRYVQDYLASNRVRIPGRPATWYYAHWASPAVDVPIIPRAEIPYLTWQNRWFTYASAPGRVEITPADRDDLFSPTKYRWGIRLHYQLVALDIYRRFNGPSAELDSAINPVAEGVARDAYWDFRVNDAYYQRSACILGAGRPDLLRSRWIERILDAQTPDGTWNYCWHGWCRGILEFQLHEDKDRGHSTIQAAWALYMLKYRYSDWIAQHYH